MDVASTIPFEALAYLFTGKQKVGLSYSLLGILRFWRLRRVKQLFTRYLQSSSFHFLSHILKLIGSCMHAMQARERHQVQLFLGPLRQAFIRKFSHNKHYIHTHTNTHNIMHAGDTIRSALRWLPLLLTSCSIPPPRPNMDRLFKSQFPRNRSLDSLHFSYLLVYDHHDHCRLRRPPRRQQSRNDLHHLLHALQPRFNRLHYR